MARTVAWLRRACEARGATVAYAGSAEAMVEYAFRLLSSLVVDLRGGMLQPRLSDDEGECKPLIVLAFYRNQLIHLFFVEGLLAVALNSFAAAATRAEVLEQVDFLRHMLVSFFFLFWIFPFFRFFQIY